jgi:hypothetical protein
MCLDAVNPIVAASVAGRFGVVSSFVHARDRTTSHQVLVAVAKNF